MKKKLRSKIHQATVTEADLGYVGSITIDKHLLDKANMEEGEEVLVVDNTNGERLRTYTIAAEEGSGKICMNGAAAHKINTGDEIIIMAFEITDEPVTPTNILVDDQNQFVRHL